MDKWTELRTAYQVARSGTVSAAADALGVHRATVNRHIDVLEAEIGAPVFIRHARGYTLTELGQDVLRVAQKTEQLIDDLAGRARGATAQIEGKIKLTTLAPFARLLMDAVSEFRVQNPNCLVEIDASEDLAKLEYGEAHVAVRAGPKPDHPDYVVRLFRHVHVNLYAHDRYIETHGMPMSDSDLEGHKFVGSLEPDARNPHQHWLQTHVKRGMISVSTRNTWVNLDAVNAGLGMGFLPTPFADELEELKPVLTQDPNWSVPFWLVTHVDLHRTDKVQAMLKCLAASQQKTPTL